MNQVNQIQNPEEETLFISLRATDWHEFTGQKTVKENLHIAITAAKKRNHALDHVLLSGPPGLGKTTLAHIIAKQMGVNIKITSGPAIERAGDLAAILTSLEPRDILFIDEIHRLTKAVEETLYPAMEDFALDIVMGKGPAARTLRLDLPPFTIVGATTRAGLLSAPMRDRFGVLAKLNFYLPNEIEVILTNAANKLGIGLHHDAKKELSIRSRGTPRIALRLLKRLKDVATVANSLEITPELLHQGLRMLEIDSAGLDTSDQKLLLTIIEKFSGGPVGIETLAASLSEDIGTIEDVIEPYLMQIGFLKRSPRGRIATHQAYFHLGKTPPNTA